MTQNNINTDPTAYVAIDVSKDTLQIQDDHRSFAADNNTKGYTKLLAHLKTHQNTLVVFEATGGYERGLREFLNKKDVPFAMVNPARVRDFARSEGVRAKTDPIDTRMILAFAKSKDLQAMKAPSEVCAKLAALLDRRGHLVEHLTREKNRLQNSESLILRSIKKMIKILEREIEVLDKAIDELVKSDSGLKARSEIIQSVQGVGKITAWTLLAHLSEIESVNRNKLVALAGIAPFNRDSGKSSRKRAIIGGRSKVRKCLYMAAHSAASCNPVIARYVKGLRDRAKPYKCAIVAAMRKLLIHIQVLLKKAQLAPC